jgi:hypothetical protein
VGEERFSLRHNFHVGGGGHKGRKWEGLQYPAGRMGDKGGYRGVAVGLANHSLKRREQSDSVTA